MGGSPGSSFKPFALAAGLKDGFSLKDTFDGNAPFVLPDGGGEVGNQGEGKGQSYGSAISLITATENSVNTAYVDLTTSMEEGPQKVVKMANALGVPKNAPGLKPFPAVALGSATVSPIDMANSYATIANGGVHHDWFTVKRVTRASDKKVLYKAPRKKNRVLSEDIASDVSYALQQTVQNGTATHRARTRPTRCRQDRHRDQRRRGRVVLVVRGLHTAGLDGRDVRAWQGQPGAQRLPAHRSTAATTRRLDLDRGDDRVDGGRRGRGLPAARVRRR